MILRAYSSLAKEERMQMKLNVLGIFFCLFVVGNSLVTAEGQDKDPSPAVKAHPILNESSKKTTTSTAPTALMAAEGVSSIASSSVPNNVTQQSGMTAGGSGALLWGYPIQIPSGTNGVQPSISINYNSMGWNDLLGL